MALFQRFLAALCNRKYVELEKKPKPKPKSKYDGYQVEYLTEANIYVCAYGSSYLQEDWPSRLAVVCSSRWPLIYAKQFKTEDAAWKFIDKHIEQQTKETVKIFTR